MSDQTLKRELGLWGAVVTGLGSIIGTGAFVAIGIASSLWGDRILYAIPAAALVAVFSGISSAYLAGRYPVAGGTYEYAYETLGPLPGFTAGWLFVLAKTASAAAAALGVALYLGLDGRYVPLVPVIVVGALILTGVRRTAIANVFLVVVSVTGILWFVVSAFADDRIFGWVGVAEPRGALLGSIAFLFVAFTGYGRIATLGEEVKDPTRTIPRAVLLTLSIAAVLYMAIALAGRDMGGPYWGSLVRLTAREMPVVRFAAVIAMLGVLLNLVLGLSRVWLAMGRRSDMPSALGKLDRNRQPRNAVLLAALLVAAVTFAGDIGLTWSFSAMTVLLYYAITNLSVLAIDRSRITAWLGLGSCLLLSFFVPLTVWALGLALIIAGVLWKSLVRRGA